MAANDYGKRFQESTRGRVVELLRLRSRTVEDLAQELGLTDNAVRTHLATLERDGIVRQEGVRRGPGAGKPAWIFGITPAAEPSFSKAYIPLLLALLEELSESQDPEQTEAVMRRVGRRLAAAHVVNGDRAARMNAAAALLRDLGAVAEVKEENGRIVVQGNGCVVGLAVSANATVCRAIETLLAEITGEPVHECCNRGERASCCFHIGQNGHAV